MGRKDNDEKNTKTRDIREGVTDRGLLFSRRPASYSLTPFELRLFSSIDPVYRTGERVLLFQLSNTSS